MLKYILTIFFIMAFVELFYSSEIAVTGVLGNGADINYYKEADSWNKQRK